MFILSIDSSDGKAFAIITASQQACCYKIREPNVDKNEKSGLNHGWLEDPRMVPTIPYCKN